MSNSPITLEDGMTTLRKVGCAPSEDRPAWLCPRCRTAELAVSQNGAGPHFDCGGDCGDVGAYLATIAHGLPGGREPVGEHVDQIAVLRDKLALPELDHIVKDGRRGDHYSWHLNDGRVIAIGPVSTLTSQLKCRNAVLPQLRRNLPRLKATDWDDVAERIEMAAEERDTIATAEEEALGWIAGWLRRTPLQRVDLAAPGQPWEILGSDPPAFRTTDGRLYLRLTELLHWISRNLTAERVTQNELSRRLACLGFTKPKDGGQLAARRGDDIRKARYWISPPDFEATR